MPLSCWWQAGRDWSGLMVNISTQNVLAEHNDFIKVMHCHLSPSRAVLLLALFRDDTEAATTT